MKSVSIIIPVFNEEDNVGLLHKEIVEVCSKNNYVYEVIFVDDGSLDKTFINLSKLNPVKIIRLRRNFGQTAALDAGFKYAVYDYVITMDGDLQNDPNDIPALVDYLEENKLDVVSGWRKNRKDPFSKRFISRGANLLRKLLINDGIHDSGCTLKIYKRECFEGLSVYGEMHRFIPALLKIRGFKIGEMKVNHRERHAGQTKYKLNRTIKGLIDMISVWFWNKFSVRPLHLLGSIGLVCFILGFFSGLKSIYDYFTGVGMSDTAWPLMTVFFLLSGIQLFIFGLIADTLLKSYYETTKNQSYHIKEIKEIAESKSIN